MQQEPAELQILRQALGHERGGDVFALCMMAQSLAQMSQQVAEQAAALGQVQQQAQQAAPAEAPTPATENHWTGPVNGVVKAEDLEIVGVVMAGQEGAPT